MTINPILRINFKSAYARKSFMPLMLLGVVMCTLIACTPEPERNTLTLRGDEAVRQKNTAFQVEFPDRSTLQAKVRIRGNSSLKYPKKSFRIKVPQPVSLCDLPTHKVWILNANYIDKSFIRHRLSFDLFRAMGAHNLSPQGCYLNVELNENYHGLYFAHQRIDRARCGISRQQPGGLIFKEPPVFIPKESGANHQKNYWGQKYPSYQKRNDSSEVLLLRDFLFHASDSTFNVDVEHHFDLDNVADWMLLLLFTNSTDALLRNFYLYRLHEGLPFRIAIWDYDETFGRFGDGRLNNIETELDFRQNPLLQRLFAHDDFRQRLKSRWANHRSEAFTEAAIQQRIDGYVEELKPLVTRNFESWPVDGPGYPDSTGFDDEVQLVRDFVSKRLETLDKRIAEW